MDRWREKDGQMEREREAPAGMGGRKMFSTQVSPLLSELLVMDSRPFTALWSPDHMLTIDSNSKCSKNSLKFYI